MKPLHYVLLVLLTASQLAAQDAYHTSVANNLQTTYSLPAGTWVLPNTETATLSGSVTYGATATNFAVSDQAFTQGRSFDVTVGQYSYSSGHTYKNSTAIASGDKCLVVMWLRSPTANAQVNVFAENAVTYDKEIYLTLKLTDQWTRFLLPFESGSTYAVNAMSIGLHLAAQTQTIELGGIAVLNYANSVNLDQLPVEYNSYYDGQEADAPWRADAAASIEQIRKANLKISVRDANGTPIPNAVVAVKMQQHEFGFGTAVVSNLFNGGTAQNNVYELKLYNLDGNGHGFNEVVFENDHKWDAWEEHWLSSQAEIASDMAWLAGKGMRVRGHNLVWPGFNLVPDDIAANQNNHLYVKNRIRAHLQDILTYPGVGGNACVDWDVLNEITEVTGIANSFAGKPGYVTGRELYPEIFRQADSLVPDVKLYLNDYVAIEQGDGNGNLMTTWKSRINELVAANTPLEGIGFQGHFGASPTGIPKVKAIYDDFYNTYGLEAKVTEYDINKFATATTQSDYMRDILTVTFAHPSMKAFLMWGFWDGAHWLGNAPIYKSDWTLKPSGQTFIDLVFKEWWTDTLAVANTAGIASVRGFRGTYEITVKCGTDVQTKTITLDGNKQMEFGMLCVVGSEEASQEQISLEVMPNIVKDQLSVVWSQIESGQSLNFSIYDMNGKLIVEAVEPYPASKGQKTLQLGQMPAGLYTLKAACGGKQSLRKFVVE